MKRSLAMSGLTIASLMIFCVHVRADSAVKVGPETLQNPKDMIDRGTLDRPVTKNPVMPKVTLPKDPDNLFFQVFDCNAQAPAGQWISDQVTCPNGLYNSGMVVKIRYFEGKNSASPVGKSVVYLDASETSDFKKVLGSKEISFSDGGLAGFQPYMKPFKLLGPAYVSNRYYLRVRDGATTSNVVEYDTSISPQ